MMVKSIAIHSAVVNDFFDSSAFKRFLNSLMRWPRRMSSDNLPTSTRKMLSTEPSGASKTIVTVSMGPHRLRSTPSQLKATRMRCWSSSAAASARSASAKKSRASTLLAV
jgi:hypothetical protein